MACYCRGTEALHPQSWWVVGNTDLQLWKRKSLSIQKFPPGCIQNFISQRAQEDSDNIVIIHHFKDHRPLKSLNKIHHLNDFKVYTSVSLGISIMLGKYHNLILTLTLPLPWQPLFPALVCGFLFMNLFILDTSSIWNHTICGLLWSASFT